MGASLTADEGASVAPTGKFRDAMPGRPSFCVDFGILRRMPVSFM